MAVNQISLFFYPPRWQQRLVEAPHRLTDVSRPFQLVDAVRIPSDEGPAVEFDSVCNWLVARGFTVAEWREGRIFERGQVRSIFGIEKEIKISIGE